MISRKDMVFLRRILEDCQNPVFLFDNDPDGICSAAILLRNIKKGRAFVLKSIDSISEKLQKKIFSFYPTDVFILDKPIYDSSFIDKAKQKNIRVAFIDHHEQKKDKYCLYFNSYPTSEPVSFIAQKIFDSRETRILSLIGCISDVFIPDFFEDEKNKHPDLFGGKISATDILYSSDFGKAIQILSLSLMNNDVAISRILNFLLKINSPYDLLVGSEDNFFMHKRYEELNEFIDKNINKTRIMKNLAFLEFSGKYSLSSEIANRLFFLQKDKFVIVCYKKEDFINISLRGEKSKIFVEKVLSRIENSIGGGHEKACGMRIPSSGYEQFKKLVSDFFSITF